MKVIFSSYALQYFSWYKDVTELIKPLKWWGWLLKKHSLIFIIFLKYNALLFPSLWHQRNNALHVSEIVPLSVQVYNNIILLPVASQLFRYSTSDLHNICVAQIRSESKVLEALSPPRLHLKCLRTRPSWSIKMITTISKCNYIWYTTIKGGHSRLR